MSPSLKSRAAFAVFGLILLLSLPACSTPERAPELSLEPTNFRGGGEEVEAEAGSIRVPLDRRDPESRTIELRFVRFRSTSATPGAPIVYLAGGPGGSGIGAAQGRRFALFQALRTEADVIAFDQRGTGDSEPRDMVCEGEALLDLERPGDPERDIDVYRERVRACIYEMRKREIDLDAFTTYDSADDLDDLRRALGADKISLWGISYGTHLALATARRHPDRIERMILAGVEGPNHTFKLPGNIQKNLERLAVLVHNDPAYASVMPNLERTLASVLERLEREPVVVEVLPGLNVAVSRWDLQRRLAQGMGSRNAMQQLPAQVYAMSQGEFWDVASAVYAGRQRRRVFAMSSAMDCASYATAGRLESIVREGPQALLGATIDFPYPGLCEDTGLPRLGDQFRSELISDIPTLFISGTLDGRTPPTNAEEVAAGFRNHVHLVIERAAHSDDLFLSSPEIVGTMVAFVRGDPLQSRSIEGPVWNFSPPFSNSLAREVLGSLSERGYQGTVDYYRLLRKAHEGQLTYDFSEGVLNTLGYTVLGAGLNDLAIEIFKLNTVAYPDGANTWDSLGEAYKEAGETQRAIASYEKSLKLDPGSGNAERMLRGLREAVASDGSDRS